MDTPHFRDDCTPGCSYHNTTLTATLTLNCEPEYSYNCGGVRSFAGHLKR